MENMKIGKKNRLSLAFFALVLGYFTLFVSLTSAAFAFQNDSRALRKYHVGDFDEAIRLWAPMAIGGNPEAQFYIGDMFQNGLGVEEDMTTALIFYRAGAERGHVKSERTLAEIYFVGDGVELNLEKALQYYWSAGIKGDPISQYHLGRFYLNGEGVEKNIVQAYAWLDRAVYNGNSSAGPLLVKLHRTLDQNQITQGQLLSENLEVGPRKWGTTPLENIEAIDMLTPFTVFTAVSQAPSVNIAPTAKVSEGNGAKLKGMIKGQWQIHLGAYRDEAHAIEAGQHLERQAPALLRGKKWATLMANKNNNRAKFYRLRLGAYESFDGAKDACSDLILKGFSCMVASK